MHYFLKRTLRDEVIPDCERTNKLRSDDEALRDRARARAARALLLHDAPTATVEAWLAAEFPAEAGTAEPPR